MKKAHKIYQQELVTLSYSLSGKMKNILALSTDCVSCSRCLHRYNTNGNGLKLKQVIENFTDILATFNDMFSFSTITASDSIINPIRKQIDRNVKRYGLINYCYSMGY